MGLLAILVPISVYNFIETMNNVEAMATAGDNYNVSQTQLFDGIGTMVGSIFGGVFPTTVYIASISAKWSNAGRGYSILNGIVFLISSTLGIIAAMPKFIPLPVVAPILVFVGVSMVSQTFASVDEKHYPTVVLAMFPYLANYISSKFATSAPEALANLSPAVVPCSSIRSRGNVYSTIMGAILVFILDNDLKKASIMSLIGAILAAIGFIHAPKLSLFYDYRYALAYLIMGMTFPIPNVTLKDCEDEE